jgi:LytTr DNA-binding domain
MFKIFTQPYPFVEKTTRHAFLQSAIEGIFVALFLVIIQPFDTSNIEIEHKNLYLASYGMVTFFCAILLRFGIFKAFPNFFSETKWTIAREIASILFLIFLIALGNILLTIFLFNISFTFKQSLEMLVSVLTIGVFPISFGVLVNYIIQLKKYNKPFDVEKGLNSPKVESNQEISLLAENEKDKIDIDPKNLVYITSSDNYSTVFFLKNNELDKELIRSSLSRLENQIQNEKIVRTHRSFIVNLMHVQKVSGNAQGYKLHIQDQEIQLPVARKYANVIEQLRSK